MKKKKCLFLGYTNKETDIIKFLRRKNFIVLEHRNKLLSVDLINKYNLILSYGYRRIIKKNIIKQLKRPIINLHISYLPFNRGADPNFWSFKNKTPKGVTIHEIDDGIDTGNILFRKKINFLIKKNTSLKDTYLILRNEMEKLFKKNFNEIISGKYKKIKQISKKKLNLKKNLPKKLNWDTPIKKLFS
jgi:methionyl-tRNA formyltransferase